MIRMILGAFISLLFLIMTFDEIAQFGFQDIHFLLLCLVLSSIGVPLFFSGRLARAKSAIIYETIFSMCRENGKIDILSISSSYGLTEMKVRKIVGKAKRKKLISENIEVI